MPTRHETESVPHQSFLGMLLNISGLCGKALLLLPAMTRLAELVAVL